MASGGARAPWSPSTIPGEAGAEDVESAGRGARLIAGRRLLWVAAGAALLVAAIAAAALSMRPRPSSLAAGPTFQAQVSDIGARCTLPITSVSGSALLDFPGGQLHLTGPGPVAASAVRNEAAYEQVRPAYDARQRRWLPGVKPQWIAPDGAAYAEATVTRGAADRLGSSELRVVDVGTGNKTVLWKGPGVAYLLGYGPDGIYFSTGTSTNPVQLPGEGGPEVWVVAADGSGPARTVGPKQPSPPDQLLPRGFQTLGAGAAWAIAQVSTASTPPAASFSSDRILRMDLRTGAVSTFFQGQPDEELELMGVDARGEPLVLDLGRTSAPPAGYFDSLPSVRLIEPSGAQITISRPRSYFVPNVMVADSGGIWFGGPGSVWRYDSVGGIRQVARIPTQALPFRSDVSPAAPPVPQPSDYPFAGPSGQALLSRLGTGVTIAGPCT